MACAKLLQFVLAATKLQGPRVIKLNLVATTDAVLAQRMNDTYKRLLNLCKMPEYLKQNWMI